MNTILFAALSLLVVDLKDYSVVETSDEEALAVNPDKLVLKKLPGEKPLYAGVYEVMQGQWELVMGDRPSFFANPDCYKTRPVECVSYIRALYFVRRLTAKTGLEISLPTMDEWEYAARAGATNDFLYADRPLDELGRYWNNGGRHASRLSGPEAGTAKVGSYAPNAWGLYDVLGNVREWCLGDPQCGSRKWTRGGAWALPAKKCILSNANAYKFAQYFPDEQSEAPTSGFRVFSHGTRVRKLVTKEDWWTFYLDPPKDYVFTNKVEFVRRFDWPECDGELYRQRTGPKTWQTLLMTFPKNRSGKVPLVVVPYYRPDMMIARDFESGKDMKGQLCVAFLRHAAERGWAAVSAETFQENYLPELQMKEFSRWSIISDKFNRDWPTWNCMAKKVFDTKLATDFACRDERIDATRLGILGHSLGGQSAFYSGLLDDRFKVVVASDFGTRFDQTFWESSWYWGDKLKMAREDGLENADLIRFGKGKPLCVISGKTDDETSGEYVLSTGVYDGKEENFLFLNHQTGHRPPASVLTNAYEFMAKVLDR